MDINRELISKLQPNFDNLRNHYDYADAIELLEEFVKLQVPISTVTSAYKFPNGMIATFHGDDQIPSLQGRDTPELRDKIRKHSDHSTQLHGF